MQSLFNNHGNMEMDKHHVESWTYFCTGAFYDVNIYIYILGKQRFDTPMEIPKIRKLGETNIPITNAGPLKWRVTKRNVGVG